MMGELIGIRVSQVRIFSPDELPFNHLRLDANIKRISKEFSFRQAMMLGPQQTGDLLGGVTFFGGTIISDSGQSVIEQIIIESRRVIIAVAGDSTAADSVFGRLKDLLKEFDQRQNKPLVEPIVTTQDTTTIMRLQFPISKIFSMGSLGAFTKELDTKVEQPLAKARIFPSSIKFRVSYYDIPESFKAKNVELLDKEIVIEYRVGTAIEENTYFISSPSRSDIHLEMVEFLEHTFAK
jgi:hypothetical protein